MKALVSILIPAYNAQDVLANAIQSAVNQSWRYKEIIVVDDGSTDATLAVARRFESSDVRVVPSGNGGAAAARNLAYSLSRGQYIQWLDADDILDRDKLVHQMRAVEDGLGPQILLSGAWGSFYYRHRKAAFRPAALWHDLTPVEWLTRKMRQNLYMQTATWLVSRELTEAAGAWNTSLLGDDDGEYFCRVLLASQGTRFIPESKVYYRASGTSSLSYIGFSDRKMEAQWRSMQLHVGYLRSLEESVRVDEACTHYLQNWLVYFHPRRLDLVKQAQDLAAAWDAHLRLPTLSWKYSWIKMMLGESVANRAKVFLPGIRWSAVRYWDKTLAHLEKLGIMSLGANRAPEGSR
jgi:glycosyltransferase involved in cell wall biosynthesis